MSFYKLFGLAVMGVFCCALSSLAQGIYIAQTSQGSDTGADAADAHSVAWLNTSANWGAGTNQVGAGGVVHLCGTILNPITIQASGVVGNPITIYFESNCVMTAPYWPIGAISMTSMNNVVVNGGVNGVITASSNGSALAYQTNSAGVAIYSSQNVTVENLSIVNMYRRTSSADEAGGYGGEKGVGVIATPNGLGFNYCANITVSNCIMSDLGVGGNFAYDVNECSNYFFISNVVSRCDLGAICGDRESGALLNGFICSNNHVYDFSNWDDTVGDYYHHDAFYIFANAANSVCSNAVFDANLIGPDFGANSTAGLFVTGNCPSALLYNNVFVANSGNAPDDAFIYLAYPQGSSSRQPYTPGNGGIYNNTFRGGGSGLGILVQAVSGTNYVENNLAIGMGTFISYIYTPTNSLVSNHNLFNGLIPSEVVSYSTNYTAHFLSLTAWQSLGYDEQSANSNPLVNSEGVPQMGSPATSNAINLYSTFTTDFAGNPRPATGNWTIGAYQVATGVSIPTISVTPTSEAFGMVAVGTTTNETFTVQNTGGGTLAGSASVSTPFNIVSGGTYSLAAGQSTNVTISYNPTTTGTNSQTVIFSGGAGASVVLNGTSAMPPPQNLQPHAPGL